MGPRPLVANPFWDAKWPTPLYWDAAVVHWDGVPIMKPPPMNSREREVRAGGASLDAGGWFGPAFGPAAWRSSMGSIVPGPAPPCSSMVGGAREGGWSRRVELVMMGVDAAWRSVRPGMMGTTCEGTVVEDLVLEGAGGGGAFAFASAQGFGRP